MPYIFIYKPIPDCYQNCYFLHCWSEGNEGMRGDENTVKEEEVVVDVLPFKLTSEGVCRFLAKQSLRSCCLTGVRHYPAPRPRAAPGAPGAQ